MTFDLWPYTARLVERMADSSLTDEDVSIVRSPRSPGIHSSTLLRILHPVDSGITPEELKIYGLLGLAFEDRAERALISLAKEPDWPFDAVRSPEVFYDGVYCSPDILLFGKEDGVVQELSLKTTWKGIRDAPEGEKFAYYRDQSLTYGTPLDTTRGVLLCYFVNGEYKKYKRGEPQKPPVPIVQGWQLEWSLQERGEMWQAVRNLKYEYEGRQRCFDGLKRRRA
jgi:hypothetical protein